MKNLNVESKTLYLQLNNFFLTAADRMLVQGTENNRFSESPPFSKILPVMNVEE